MVNSHGIDVQVGKWYEFFSLRSGQPTDVKMVTDFVLNPDGTCDIVKVQGKQWYDQSSRWLNWILRERAAMQDGATSTDVIKT